MRTHARRVAIVIFDEVELLDVAAPLQVLSVAGRRWNFRPFKLELVAPMAGLVMTRNQARLEANAALSEASAADLVLVPGGYGARRFAAEPAHVEHLARLAARAELVAGIGSGVLALARAGLCSGERLAVSSELMAELGALVEPAACDCAARVVESGRVFTAQASGGALPLALALVKRTMGPKLASMVSAELGLLPDDGDVLEIRY